MKNWKTCLFQTCRSVKVTTFVKLDFGMQFTCTFIKLLNAFPDSYFIDWHSAIHLTWFSIMHWFRRKKILTVQNSEETINRSHFENYFPLWEKPLISSPSPKFESFLIFCCHRLVTCFASHFIKRVKRLIGFVRPVKENRYPQLLLKPAKNLFLSI